MVVLFPLPLSDCFFFNCKLEGDEDEEEDEEEEEGEEEDEPGLDYLQKENLEVNISSHNKTL